MLRVGSRVRIKQNAYEGSDDPSDFKARGQVGRIVGDPFTDCFEVTTPDGELWHLLDTELEELPSTDLTITPDTPLNRELAGLFVEGIEKYGFEKFEAMLVEGLELVSAPAEPGQRCYVRPDGQLKVTFTVGETPDA